MFFRNPVILQNVFSIHHLPCLKEKSAFRCLTEQAYFLQGLQNLAVMPLRLTMLNHYPQKFSSILSNRMALAQPYKIIADPHQAPGKEPDSSMDNAEYQSVGH